MTNDIAGPEGGCLNHRLMFPFALFSKCLTISFCSGMGTPYSLYTFLTSFLASPTPNITASTFSSLPSSVILLRIFTTSAPISSFTIESVRPMTITLSSGSSALEASTSSATVWYASRSFVFEPTFASKKSLNTATSVSGFITPPRLLINLWLSA